MMNNIIKLFYSVKYFTDDLETLPLIFTRKNIYVIQTY